MLEKGVDSYVPNDTAIRHETAAKMLGLSILEEEEDVRDTSALPAWDRTKDKEAKQTVSQPEQAEPHEDTKKAVELWDSIEAKEKATSVKKRYEEPVHDAPPVQAAPPVKKEPAQKAASQNAFPY